MFRTTEHPLQWDKYCSV